MYRNTRYDAQDYATLGLASRLTTTGYPLTVSGEELHRNGSKFYLVGHETVAQVYGSAWGARTRAEVDAHLDALAAAGVNNIAVAGHEQYGRGQSGALAGRQIGCFELGYWFAGVSSRNWAVGERCWTKDGSDIRRVYECITPDVGSGTTGPTGTGSDITNGTTHWRFLHTAGAVYSEEFFIGSAITGSAGFDYVLDGCARRGIYVALRFNIWDLVISGQTGYPLNGGGNLSQYFGCWPFDGEYGTPQVKTIMRGHLSQFLDRVNSVNGRRYGDDPTIAFINTWNEMGLAYWFYNSASTGSPGGNTFDYFCYTGSSTSAADLTKPTALYVAAWDAKFAAWYTATFASTPAADYGKANTLPCNGYTGSMGANVAARDTYRVGATGNDYAWRKRVNRFLRETEETMVSDMQTWLRTKSSHVLHIAGHHSWMFISSMAQSDICDIHYYANGNDTSSNTVSVTSTTAPTAGVAYGAAAGGTLTFTGMPTSDASAHPLVVGAYVRWTLTSNPSITGIGAIATTGEPWTITGVGADPGVGGTNVNCTVVIGTADKTVNEFHTEPPVDTATTRTHVFLNGVESNSDATGGWLGNPNYGFLYNIRDPQVQGKPRLTTELGNRALTPPSSSPYQIFYTLFDLLQGGSGSMRMAWIGDPASLTPGEHSLQGNGSAFISTILTALMARYITPLPTEDATQITGDDIDDWYSKKNTTDNYVGNSAGWGQFVGSLEVTGVDNQWHAFMHNRLRTKIAGITAKTDLTYTHSASGWTHPELNNANTGRLYHNRNVGTVVYENSKIVVMGTRFRGATDATETSRLTVSTLDNTYWCGVVAWASLDGSDLGTGRSALVHWMYPRDEQQRFRRHTMSGRNQYVEMLDGDSGSISNPQPGVVMRNGLRLRLAMTDTAKRARIIERYGVQREQIVSHAGGYMTILPSQPLTLIGN